MRRTWRIISALAIVALIVVGCGKSRSTTPTDAPANESAPAETAADGTVAVTEGAEELPVVNPLEVTGDIVTAGSSTVFPLSEVMAERFIDEGYSSQITVDSIGSGAGFARFCGVGESDIANASRGITGSEVEDCAKIGREPIEFRVGTDALAVTVSVENDWLTDGLTMEELAYIFSSDYGNWSDVNPAWPDEAIQRFSPGTDSGTYDYFVEEVMEEVYGDEGEAKFLKAQSLQLSEDDNVLVQGIAGSKNGIGYFGYAYFLENEDSLNVLSIDGVTADDETVDSGEYPLARPLFLYSDAGIIKSRPQVGSFLNFYLTYVNEEVDRVGYFPASEDALDASRAKLAGALNQ